ncbi:protein asteroid-like [Andrena cerasifolii]|uniref:protein asteroid-like n=1 Tax=Andrena cerasifolii TaxID=2819439 RepID=UPI004038335B
MGIAGLTTYINDHSDCYLKHYELRDTYLVIDGDNIICQLYISCENGNCAFGGDYDRYAQCVADFFDELLMCNVTPLVVIDGTYEKKKLETILDRIKAKVRLASQCCPANQQRTKIFPLMLTTVFIDVMNDKNIRYTQSLFEADNAVAAVAKALDCPVLSYDSDFYIYGTPYIQFNTLEKCVFKSRTGNGCVKRCKIYQIEYLLKSFKGLHQSMLPLAAVLLGNDYTNGCTFNNFFRRLKLPSTTQGKQNRQYRIEAIFSWLGEYTLDKAVVEILSTVPVYKQQELLNVIETNVDSYTNISGEMIMFQLGFSKEYVDHASVSSAKKSFISDIGINSFVHKVKNMKTSKLKVEETETGTMNIFGKSELVFNEAILNTMPEWFLNDFSEGKYSGYFISLLVQRLYVCPVQVEDHHYPSSNAISLKILSVIFGLLKSEMDDKTATLKYVMRNRNTGIACLELEGTDTVSLSKLREIPRSVRKEILNDALEVANEPCINELLPEWMLYVACIKYWLEQRELYKYNKCYVYSLLLSMLFNVLDSKIGKHRIQSSFQKIYGQVIEAIKLKKDTNNDKPDYSPTVTISQARDKITFDDCLLAVPFFMHHFEVDDGLYSKPHNFNRSIVHAFAEFQICLDLGMHLNALLGNPYPQTKVANMFNGTLLYNLYGSLSRYSDDIEGFINYVFEKSPSLLRLFKTLLFTIKPLFPSLAV